MSSFTDPLAVQTTDGRRWTTSRAMTYWTDCAAGDQAPQLRCRTAFTVPEGFETDFASIPRLFWPWIGHPAGEYVQAAVLHDWLYRAQVVPRARADAIFREAMQVLGVAGWKRWVMWAAVRVGGGIAYELGSRCDGDYCD